jgi:hypothetical protein
MKVLFILAFLSSTLFAITPVPRNSKAADNPSSVGKTVVANNDNKDDKKDDDKDKDKFKDDNKNGVNDQREEDFQKIKELKTKHKDVLKKKTESKKTTSEPVKSKKVPKKTSK